MSKLTALGHLGMAFETTYGTAVAPAVFIPYETIKVEDSIKKVTDESRRGVLSKTFAVYNATREGKVEFETLAYPELLGYFFKAALGQDTVTGTSPYTHTFKVVNSAAPSMTLSDNNTVTQRNYAGALLDELTLKYDTESVMKVSTKWISKASVTTTTATNTYTATNPFMGYAATLSLNSVSNLNMVGGEVKIKRESKLLFTANNTQDPSKAASSRIDITGKLTFDVEDETEFALFTAGTQGALVLTFTRDANTTLTITCTKADITKANIDRSQEFLRVDLEFKAMYNTTDAGMAQIVLKNSVSTY
jgi:hypothetical protein